jgi:hypothetical protein
MLWPTHPSFEGDLFVDTLPYTSPNGGVYQDETGELYTMDPVDGCLHSVYKGHNWNQYMLDKLDTDRQDNLEQSTSDPDSTDQLDVDRQSPPDTSERAIDNRA